MEENCLEDYYNQLYLEIPSAFGGEKGEAVNLVKVLPEYLKSGKILELGAGQGRNALWLAQRNFQVEARDISSVGLQKIKESADKKGLEIKVVKADARRKLRYNYDAIVSTFMLHHLTRTDSLKVIQEIRMHTKQGGYNLIATFTKDGDFFRDNPATDKFYPKRGELKKIYKNWEVLEYQELNVKARQKRKDGSSMFNVSSLLLARKSTYKEE